MSFVVPVGAQSVKPQAPQKTQKKPVQKLPLKAQIPQKKQGMQLRGKLEKLECKLGTEDRHARIAVELVGGRLKSLAYYSKWKPRTCSVHIVRDDAYSKWEDPGSVTVVTLNEEKGAFLIDYSRTAVKFLFRDIDRERFCGMTGKITGTLTVTRGRNQCELEGVMDEPVSDEVKEVAGDPQQDVPKDLVRDAPRVVPNALVKDAPGAAARELPGDAAKEPLRDLPKDLLKEPPAVAPRAP